MNLCLNLALSWVGKRVFVPPTAPTAVSFQSLTANGTSGTVSTTQLTATLDVDPGLTTANFVVTGASKGVVSKVGAVYTININTITVDDGQSVTLDIIGVPSGFTITPTTRTVAVNKAAVYEYPDYSPTALESEFTLLPQDSNGWSIFAPSVDSQIMYVKTGGNDTTAASSGVYTYGDGSAFTDWFADEGQVAFATIEAAYDQCRSGFPDYVCIYTDDEIDLSTTITANKSGRGLLEPMVICTYGPGGRAIINRTTTDDFFRNVNQDLRYIAFSGIAFRRNILNPEHPDFVGWASFTTGQPVLNLYNDGTVLREGILFEDCDLRDTDVSIYLSGEGADHVVMRRNMMTRTSNSAFLWDKCTLVWLEDNVFYKSGYLDYPDSTVTPTIYKHSYYFTRFHKLISKNNISIAPSNNHFKHTANADTGIGSNTIQSSELHVIDNLVMLGGFATQCVGNFGVDEDYLDGPRAEFCDVSGNVGVGLGRQSDRTAWGIQVASQKDTTSRRNIIVQTGGDKTSGAFAVAAAYDITNASLLNNIAHDIATDDAFNADANGTKTGVVLRGNLESQSASIYPDPTADISDYVSSIGLTGDYETLGEYLISRGRKVWADSYACANAVKFFRDAYYVRSIVVIDQPSNLLATVGQNASFTINAYTPTDNATVQWFNADTAESILGATDWTYTVADAQLADSGLSIYPVVTDGDLSVTGSTAELTVEEAVPFVTFNGTDSYATMSPDMLIRDGATGVGDYVEFDFKTTTGGTMVGESASTVARISITSTNVILQMWTNPQFNFPITGLLDGNWHKVRIEKTTSTTFIAIVDGVTINQSGTTSSDVNFRVNQLAKLGTGYFAGSIRNLTVSAAALTTYAMDSGSTTTEAASVGTGTMTFVNVISGDWD